MTCEAFVIGSIAGLALTAAVLSFQVLTDRKIAERKRLQKEEKRMKTLAANTVAAK
jgi:hypothetical protein